MRRFCQACWKKLFDRVPPDLAAYFEATQGGSFSDRQDLEVNLLPPQEVKNLTEEFRSFHPAIQLLEGVVLDDADLSNYHAYLLATPCAGAVYYLDHDGDSRIVFRTLLEFLDAVRAVIREDRALREFHPESGVLLADQEGLTRFAEQLYEDGEVDVVLTLIPSMDLKATALLERLAIDTDFYLGEAIGDAISRRPTRALTNLATICQMHPHPQASQAGVRALAAIAQLPN